jgi:hypothetical protein
MRYGQKTEYSTPDVINSSFLRLFAFEIKTNALFLLFFLSFPAGNLLLEQRNIRAESAQLYPAAEMSDWIFYQEKSTLTGAGSGIPMRILL